MKKIFASLIFLAALSAHAQAPPAPSTAPSQAPAPQTHHKKPPVVNPTQAGHEADLNYSNPGCTTASPCTLQIYRAQCDNATTCPAYIYSPQSFKTLNMAGLTTNASATGTTWSYADTDTALADNTSYSWVSTATNTAGVSGPSTPFLGTIPALPTTVAPPAPTTGQCKIIK